MRQGGGAGFPEETHSILRGGRSVRLEGAHVAQQPNKKPHCEIAP